MMSEASGSVVFRRTSKLVMHRKEKHNMKAYGKKMSLGETQPASGKRRRKSAYPCKKCGKLFLHHLSLNAHYGASSCRPATGNDSKLTGHVSNDKVKSSLTQGKTVRAGPGRPKKKKDVEVCGEFPCPSCTQIFSLQSKLKQHVELHDTATVRRECSLCTEDMDTFEQPGSLRQRFYHCMPCQEGFTALDSFLQHCQEHLQSNDEKAD
ncbi:uncharacterized protein LOC144207353 [Stigmatopora nigra]